MLRPLYGVIKLELWFPGVPWTVVAEDAVDEHRPGQTALKERLNDCRVQPADSNLMQLARSVCSLFLFKKPGQHQLLLVRKLYG